MSSDATHASEPAVVVRGLEKTYRIAHREKNITLTEELLARARRLGRSAPKDEFHALRGVDLTINEGEIVGVIGHNGAGKSTLLKVMSRITAPSAGRVELHGRVGSLLEVGTGFHAELTGRENIYLSGAILGMTSKEVDREFDRIVEFAGVSRFLDTPVKRYSSGMYVRLGFSVAAHLRTEILLIDEVLAVGDREFHQKAATRMRELVHDGRTVMLVSHSMGLISEVASRVVLLNSGRIAADGAPATVIAEYTRTGKSASQGRRPRLGLSGDVLVEKVSAEKNSTAAPLRMVVAFAARTPQSDVRVAFTIKQMGGAPIGASYGESLGPMETGERSRVELTVPALPLAAGVYSVDVSAAVSHDGGETFDDTDVLVDASFFEVPSTDGTWNTAWGALRIPSPTQRRYASED